MSLNPKQNLYFWSGINNQGIPLTGSERAPSVAVLKYKLHKQQIICAKVRQQRNQFVGLKQWLNSKHSQFFLSQLATILTTGINLNQALDIVSSRHSNKLLTRLHMDIRHHLHQGKPLSTILENYPTIFDAVIIQIIKSGEITGNIDQSMQQANEYLQQKSKLSNDLLTAVLYPVILGVVTAGVLGIMLVFVIPQFETIYNESNSPLPFLTVCILSASRFIKTNLTLLFFMFAAMPMAGAFLSKKTRFEVFSFIPGFNPTLRQLLTLRLCETLNRLYRSGQPITDALEVCKKFSENYLYQTAIDNAIKNIRRGDSLAQALQKTCYFESMFIQLIKTGEQSSSLEIMLEQCSKYYKKQLNDRFTRLKIILEPLLVVILGSIVGIILVAMYLPVFNLSSNF